MMRRYFQFLALAAFLAALPLAGQAQQTPAPAPAAAPAEVAPTPAPVDPAPGATPDPNGTDTESGDAVSIGEIPTIETVELTPDLAKKAIDGYVIIHEKYQDSPLEDYETLQDFVDKDAKGKELQTDLTGLGFTKVNDWFIAVTSVSYAYNNILDDQTADIKQQIEEIKASKDLAQDEKDRQVKSLEASIPSENNRKIVDDIMKDTVYGTKIKLLETTEE